MHRVRLLLESEVLLASRMLLSTDRLGVSNQPSPREQPELAQACFAVCITTPLVTLPCPQMWPVKVLAGRLSPLGYCPMLYQ